MLKLTKYGETNEISFRLGNYVVDKSLYVGLLYDEGGYLAPWSNLTVNLGIKCADNCAFIDTNNNGNDIIAWLEDNGLGKQTGRTGESGWCLYPEFEFNMDQLMEHVLLDNRCEK